MNCTTRIPRTSLLHVLLIFAVIGSANSLLLLSSFFGQQILPIPLIQEQQAYGFHMEAQRNTTSHARQVVLTVEQNLNATRQALLDANLTDAFFHLGIAQNDLSALKQGNATIGMYTVFPR